MGGMTVEKAKELVKDCTWFGTMMMHMGKVDGMVSGAQHSTPRYWRHHAPCLASDQSSSWSQASKLNILHVVAWWLENVFRLWSDPKSGYGWVGRHCDANSRHRPC